MPGHTYRIEQRAAGWRVWTVDDAREEPRDFADLDAGLRWCGERQPLAIQMPDHAFIPTAQGPGLEISADHTLFEP